MSGILDNRLTLLICLDAVAAAALLQRLVESLAHAHIGLILAAANINAMRMDQLLIQAINIDYQSKN